jgi:hypothetical protein
MGVPRYPALDAPATHGRKSTTSGANVTSTPSCQYPVCGPLAVLDIGAVIAGRPSDRGPRRDITTAPLTHSDHCAVCHALRIHRYGVAVSARHLAMRASGAA